MRLVTFSPFVLFIFCCGIIVSEVVAPAASGEVVTSVISKSRYNYWQKKAILDFVAIERALKKHHAGIVDQESGAFREWLVDGRKDFNERLKLIDSQPGWRFALKAYVSGFHDIHVQLFTTFEKKDEWPRFLLQFDGAQFVVVESRLRSVPNGSVVTKIDGVNVKEWIDKNILLYSTVDIAETMARYAEVAFFALVWQNNPFIVKPKTVSVLLKKHAQVSEKEVVLAWQALSVSSCISKFRRIQNRSFFQEFLSPLRIEDVAPSVAWIKISTFSPRGRFAQFMFNRNLKKLLRKADAESLVFDLRGNGGGLIHNALAVLVYLYGLDAVKEAHKKCCGAVGINVTTKIARALLSRPDDGRNDDGVFDFLKNRENESLLMLDPEGVGLPVFSSSMQKKLPKTPTQARVYVVVDSGVASASLYLIDYLKQLTNGPVVLVGQSTLADTTYVGVRDFRLNKDVTLTVPCVVDYGRPRAYNQPYLPDYNLSAVMMKNDKWLQKTVLEIIAQEKIKTGDGAKTYSDFEFFQKTHVLAIRGDAEACFWLGKCYHFGRGVLKNGKKALEWYDKAAQGGIAGAWSLSANIYLYGYNVSVDVKKGLELLHKAFQANDPYAIWSFGVFYFDGEFVEKDEARGIWLLRKAVRMGSEIAQEMLDERLEILEKRKEGLSV